MKGCIPNVPLVGWNLSRQRDAVELVLGQGKDGRSKEAFLRMPIERFLRNVTLRFPFLGVRNQLFVDTLPAFLS